MYVCIYACIPNGCYVGGPVTALGWNICDSDINILGIEDSSAAFKIQCASCMSNLLTDKEHHTSKHVSKWKRARALSVRYACTDA